MTPASRKGQLASIFAAYAAAGVYWGSFYAAIPALRGISGLTEAHFGQLLMLTTIGGILAMQAMGRVLHRVQRLAIPVCLAGFAIGMVLFGLAQGAVTLGLALFWAGAASGALDISLNMRVARLEADFPVRLFNRVHAVFPFAMLTASVIVGGLRDAGLSPAQIFPVAALVLLAAAAGEWRAGRHQMPTAAPGPGDRVRLRGMLILFGLLAGLGAVMEGGAHTWSSTFLEEHLAGGPLLGGLAAAALTLGLTAGRLTAHALEARWGDLAILRGAALLAVPALAVLALSPPPLVALGAFFLAGAGIGPVEPAIFRSVAARHPEATRGRALALATGLAYVGYLTAPPLMGALIAGPGWQAMWLALIAVALLTAGLSLRVPRGG
jgi:predicted MFS family arabinose efflux permease